MQQMNFMALRKWMAAASLSLLLVSIVSLVVKQLNLGLDFTGGALVELTIEPPPAPEDIQQILLKAGYHDVVVQSFGVPTDLLIRLS